MNTTTIGLLTSSDALVTDSTAATVCALLKQLTGRDSTFGLDDLRNLLGDKASRLFLLHHEGHIAGMLTLCTYTSPVGRKVWVEDVVIDSKLRGRGLGRELLRCAMDYVEENFAPCTLMLTSNPSRIAANELYRTAGFEQRQTNVYRRKFGE